MPAVASAQYLGAGGGSQGVALFIAISSAAALTPIDLGGRLVSNLLFPPINQKRVFADAAGHGVASFPVPLGASGATVHLQALSLAAAGGRTFASSKGLEVVIP